MASHAFKVWLSRTQHEHLRLYRQQCWVSTARTQALMAFNDHLSGELALASCTIDFLSALVWSLYQMKTFHVVFNTVLRCLICLFPSASFIYNVWSNQCHQYQFTCANRLNMLFVMNGLLNAADVRNTKANAQTLLGSPIHCYKANAIINLYRSVMSTVSSHRFVCRNVWYLVLQIV